MALAALTVYSRDGTNYSARKVYEIVELESIQSNTFTSHILRSHDVYDAFIVNMPILHMIDYIRITSSGLAIFAMSGYGLTIYAALNCPNERDGIITLPIGCELVNTNHSNLAITIDLNHRDPILVMLDEYVATDIANIIKEYAAIELSHLRVFMKASYIHHDAFEKMLRKPRYINQFHEERWPIRYGSHIVDRIATYGEIRQIIFTLNKRNCDTPLPILISGEFRLGGNVYSRFTGQSAWMIDKHAFGAPIPTAPIYTITFAAPDDHRNYINFSRTDGYLSLNIQPQCDIEVRIICVGQNIYVPDIGLRYTT